jgi:hypothetical protein
MFMETLLRRPERGKFKDSGESDVSRKIYICEYRDDNAPTIIFMSGKTEGKPQMKNKSFARADLEPT